MKKIILAAAIAAVVVVGFMFMRNRFAGFTSTARDQADLVILNDSSDTISVEYKEGGKDVSPTVKPGETATGGKGFIKIFIAKKDGPYELMYTYPRPNGTQQVTLSQVVAAAQKKELGDAVYTEKGMLGDIKVVYEEARVLDSTY